MSESHETKSEDNGIIMLDVPAHRTRSRLGSQVEKIRQDYKKVEQFVKEGRLSGENMRASRDPFGIPGIDPNANTESKCIYSVYFKEMPTFLSRIYQVIGNETRELQTKSMWMVMSLDEFHKSAENHRKEGQNKMRMFAHRYEGLGWRFIAYYIVETKKTFITMGGGSNGWDAQQNWCNAMAFDPDTLDESDVLDIEELLNMEFEEAEKHVVALPRVPIPNEDFF